MRVGKCGEEGMGPDWPRESMGVASYYILNAYYMPG